MERYCEQEKNCLRVYVPRELDHHEADRLKQEADFFIETGQVRRSCLILRERSSWTAPESG